MIWPTVITQQEESLVGEQPGSFDGRLDGGMIGSLGALKDMFSGKTNSVIYGKGEGLLNLNLNSPSTCPFIRR
jgi:hypothetical protein